MTKRAIILAGGKGTRLRPYTMTLPKPLVPLGEKPILEIILCQLKYHGFEHVTLTVNHMANVIKAYFEDGERLGIKIDYTLESKALSTMGPLTLAKNLPENFLVMNGDVLTDLNFGQFYKNHEESGSIFSISSHRRKEMIDYGLLHKNDNHELIEFEEKPTYDFLVSMGVYIVNKRALSHIPKDTFYGFDDLMYKLLEGNDRPRIHEHNGFWLDIGRPSDYELATQKIADPKFKLF